MAGIEVNQKNSEDLDVNGLLRKYLRYWYLFVAGMFICLTAAFLYLRYSTPEFQISTTLLIKDDKKGPELAGNSAFSELDLFSSSSNISNEIEVLKSKDLMHRVLKELSLYATYKVAGHVKSTEVYGQSLPLKLIIHELDSAAYDKTITLHVKDENSFVLENEDEDEETTSHQFGQEVSKPYGSFTVIADINNVVEKSKEIKVKFHDIRKLADKYNKELSVAMVSKEASVLTISIQDPVPEKGEDIIKKLIEVYNKEAVEDKNLIAASTLKFIDERLSYLTTELSAVEKEVELYKRKNQLTNVSAEANMYLESANEYNKQLAEFDIQLDVLNSIENYLKNQEEGNFEVVPSALTLQDITLQGLVIQFNELQLERKRMLRTTQVHNPIVQNINDQLSNLRLNILESLKNIRKSIIINRKSLKANSNRFEARIDQVPSIERELLEISRQQGIKEGLYLYLLQKREESALSLASAVSNSRVIDSPKAGDLPVKPRKPFIYLLGMLLGIGIPFTYIYVKELLNDKLSEYKDIEKFTATPVLGEIYHNETGEVLVAVKGNRSPVAELFRLIRSNLQFATVGKENKVILVTSSMGGEGKTFFSINLASSLALPGKKVVILGFDLRKPKLTQDLGIYNNIGGISNYLISETISISDILQDVPNVPGLSIIASGPIPPNPNELMMLPKIGDLIEELKKEFDYILIDSAPVGRVSDAFCLNQYIDSSIYITRYNYTYKVQLNIIDDIYRNKKLKQPVIVLNGAKKENSSGYGYGYGYGNEEEKQDLNWIRKLRKKSTMNSYS